MAQAILGVPWLGNAARAPSTLAWLSPSVSLWLLFLGRSSLDLGPTLLQEDLILRFFFPSEIRPHSEVPSGQTFWETTIIQPTAEATVSPGLLLSG